MADTHTYKLNGGTATTLNNGANTIDFSSLPTAGGPPCLVYDKGVMILSQLYIKSIDDGVGAPYTDKTVYFAYRLPELLCGSMNGTGVGAIINTSKVSTFTDDIRIGFFSPIRYLATGNFAPSYVDLSTSVVGTASDNIASLLNINAGLKIALKAAYTSSSGATTKYIDLPIQSWTYEFSSRILKPLMGTPTGANSKVASQCTGVTWPSNSYWQYVTVKFNVTDVSLTSIHTDMVEGTSCTFTLCAYVGTISAGAFASGSNGYVTYGYDTGDETITVVKNDNCGNTIALANVATTNVDTYATTAPYGFIGLFDSVSADDSKITITITEGA